MNLTQTPEGKFRSLSTREMYTAISLANAAEKSVYLRGGRELGYQMRIDAETRAPEIKGYSKEYLLSESLRRQEILEKVAELPGDSGRWRQIAALQTREEKLEQTQAEKVAAWGERAAVFGNESKTLLAAAIEREQTFGRTVAVGKAVDHALGRQSERQAIFEHFTVERDALLYGDGSLTSSQVQAEIQKRLEAGEIVKREHYRPHAPAARYSTRETLELEKDTVGRMLRGMGSVEAILPHADLSTRPEFANNQARAKVLEGFLKTTDQATALNGTAGSGKSTSLQILADIAKEQGYRLEGLAPTGKARDSLQEKGISAQTLQMYLVRFQADQLAERPKTLFILDEASLASTKAINQFTKTMNPQDHIILVGDDAPDPKKVGQHTSVEAGRVFQLLQQAGMKTAQLNRIHRQQEPGLKRVVQLLRVGETGKAVELIKDQGRIREHGNRSERFQAIAEAFAAAPSKTIVETADNRSRQEINKSIRAHLTNAGILKDHAQQAVLVGRDVLGEDRKVAASYRVGDVLQYRRDNKQLGIRGKSYSTVIATDAQTNKLTVRTDAGKTVTYDPAATGYGVSVYQTKRQELAVGERVQFTAASKQLGVSTRDTGTVKALDHGNVTVNLDSSGRNVTWSLKDFKHLDYAYVMTSHSSQSMTVDRVLWHVDTSDTRLRSIVNEVHAYVAASRMSKDLLVFTDDAMRLEKVLGRESESQKALSPREISQFVELGHKSAGREESLKHQQSVGLAI